MRTLTVEEIKEALEKHALWLIGKSEGECADFSNVDFTRIAYNFSGLNLRGADFHDANLRNAKFPHADLHDVNLHNADLQYANFRNAGLRYTILQGADIYGADFRDAIFQDTNINYSCLPLQCGGLNWKIDKNIATQLAYHFCSMECDDEEFIDVRNYMLNFANKFCRVGEDCKKLELIELKKNNMSVNETTNIVLPKKTFKGIIDEIETGVDRINSIADELQSSFETRLQLAAKERNFIEDRNTGENSYSIPLDSEFCLKHGIVDNIDRHLGREDIDETVLDYEFTTFGINVITELAKRFNAKYDGADIVDSNIKRQGKKKEGLSFVVYIIPGDE
jgi:hypothetical protein